MEYPIRILIVDDYRPYSHAIQKVLTHQFGFHVTVVESGEEALSRFGHARPDLVIVDMHLPGISGYDTLRSIRSLPNGERVPAVVVSGYEDLDYVQAMALLGVKGYLDKQSAVTELPKLLATIFPQCTTIPRAERD